MREVGENEALRKLQKDWDAARVQYSKVIGGELIEPRQLVSALSEMQQRPILLVDESRSERSSAAQEHDARKQLVLQLKQTQQASPSLPPWDVCIRLHFVGFRPPSEH